VFVKLGQVQFAIPFNLLLRRHQMRFLTTLTLSLLVLLAVSATDLAAADNSLVAPPAPATELFCTDADYADEASPCSKARAFAVATCAAALITIVVPDPVAGVDEIFLARACVSATRAARRICGGS